MPITVPDAVRVSINGRWSNGHIMSCVLDYITEAPLGGDFGGDDVANAAVAAWKEFVLPNLLDNYTLENAVWTDLSDAEGTTGVVAPTPTPTNQGGGTNTASQPATAVLFRKTGSTGRGQRSGRMYWPPPAEAQVDENGLIDSGQLATFQDAARKFLAMSATITDEPEYAMGVVHFEDPRPPKGTSDNRVGFITRVDDVIAQPIVATQRRRLR